MLNNVKVLGGAIYIFPTLLASVKDCVYGNCEDGNLRFKLEGYPIGITNRSETVYKSDKVMRALQIFSKSNMFLKQLSSQLLLFVDKNVFLSQDNSSSNNA